MASYTTTELANGAPTEELSGNKTFTISSDSSGSVYFTMETVANNTGSFSGQPKNALGVYDNFTSISEDSLVTSSYIASVVVPEGGGSFTFNPTTTVVAGSSLLRGTGEISLIIS